MRDLLCRREGDHLRRSRCYGLAPSFLLALAVLVGAGAAEAQVEPSEAELTAEQERLFQHLQQRPDDLDAMFEYAVISIRLGDYEQAIATLERMLIYREDLPRVKLELGSAYFRLGSYEVSRFYFDEVLASDPPPDVRARVEEFLAAIQARKKTTTFAGIASVGMVYSTNANLGPSDRFVEVFGVDAELDSEFREEDDFGVQATLQLNHAYDLGGPHGDAWVTNATATALEYFSEEAGNIEAFFLNTGPRLSLTEEADGPTIRPFVEGSVIRSGNDFLYASGGGGAEYRNPLDPDTAVFATLGARHRDFTSERDGEDSTDVYGAVGIEHRLGGGVTLLGTAFGELENAREDFSTNYELGGRAAAAYTYRPGFTNASWAPWTLAGFAQVSGRWYDEADPAVNPDVERHDRDIRVGLSHLFGLPDGWAVSLEASYFDRHSNLPNFELDSFEVGAFIRKAF